MDSFSIGTITIYLDYTPGAASITEHIMFGWQIRMMNQLLRIIAEIAILKLFSSLDNINYLFSNYIFNVWNGHDGR